MFFTTVHNSPNHPAATLSIGPATAVTGDHTSTTRYFIFFNVHDRMTHATRQTVSVT